MGGMHIAPLIARTESLHLGEALRVVTLGVHVIGHEDALRFEQIGVFFIVHLGPFPWIKREVLSCVPHFEVVVRHLDSTAEWWLLVEHLDVVCGLLWLETHLAEYGLSWQPRRNVIQISLAEGHLHF